MENKVEVIIQPITIRFSLFEDEVIYHFAGHANQQLDNMEKLMKIDVENSTLLDCNVGFLPVASVTLIRGEKNIIVDPGAHHIGTYGLLENALNQRGLNFNDIDIVVVTHWHHDHFSNLPLFKNADLVIGKGELDWAIETSSELEVKSKTEYVNNTLEVSSDSPLELAKGVVAIHTPGHTPNSISVIVEEESETVGILGDLAMTRNEYEKREFSHWYTEEQLHLLNSSLEKVNTYKLTKIIPGHDRAFNIIKK